MSENFKKNMNFNNEFGVNFLPNSSNLLGDFGKNLKGEFSGDFGYKILGENGENFRQNSPQIWTKFNENSNPLARQKGDKFFKNHTDKNGENMANLSEKLFVCAGNDESFDFAVSLGVGLVRSGANLARICQVKRPKEIVFVGTCGLYDGGELLEIYESDQAFNVEISAILGLSYSPLLANFGENFCQNFGKNLAKVSHETFLINSSNFITTDKNIAQKFAQMGFFMENMETYAIFEVAKMFAIPARAVLCATNFCDKFAHQNFLKNHAKAKIRLENYLKKSGEI